MSAPERAAEQPRPRRWRPTLAQVGAVVGIASGIVGLVFVFKPVWKPVPPVDAGKLTIDRDSILVRPASFGRFLQRTHSPAGTLSRAYLRQRGVLIEFKFVATGFRGQTLPIRRELVDTRTNDLVPEAGTNPSYSDESVGLTLDTNNEARKWFVWSPVPRTNGRYYVTVTIYQPRKGDTAVPLDDFDSPVFPGLAATP